MMLKVLLTGVLRLLTHNLQESTGMKTLSFHANAMLTAFSSGVTSFHILFVSSNKPALQFVYILFFLHSTAYARYSLQIQQWNFPHSC
jgi:hypothetical protein